jgi:hypothetical protein
MRKNAYLQVRLCCRANKVFLRDCELFIFDLFQNKLSKKELYVNICFFIFPQNPQKLSNLTREIHTGMFLSNI